MGFFSKLKEGLSKTKNSFNEKMNNVFSNFRKVDEELLEELEEVLIMSDVGVETSLKIIDNLRTRIKREKIEDEEGVKKALREEIKKIFDDVQENNEERASHQLYWSLELMVLEKLHLLVKLPID